MKIEKTTTGIIIHDPTDEMKRKILRYFSLSNPTREFFIYTGNDSKFPLFGNHDTIYITSGIIGIKDEALQKMLRGYKTLDVPTPASIDIEMNMKPRSKLQEDCIQSMISNTKHKLAIEVRGGVGKGNPYYTRIPTPTKQGFTLMGDLHVGDYVFDRAGRPTKILEIFELGEEDVYKVTFNDRRNVLCTGEHLWTVKTHKNGNWCVRQLNELIDDYKRLAPGKLARGIEEWVYKYYIPTCESVEYPHQDVPIDPWVLGCFIGNGCCTCQTLEFSSGTDEIPERIADMYDFYLKYPYPSNYTYRFYDKKTGKPIRTRDFFKGIEGIVDHYSYEKYIPDEYLYNDVETRLRLLQGLMDTDGSISYCGGRYHTTYSSTSKKLLEQIQWIVRSLGYSANIIVDKRKDKYTSGFCGTLIFRVPNTYKRNLFTLSNKLERAMQATDKEQKNHYKDLFITDIRKVDRAKCRCILVDNPEHLYLANDFIVTHNTFMSSYAIAQMHLKPLIIAPTANLKNQWIENFENFGIERKDIATNIHDGKNKKLTVVTIASLGNELRKDWRQLMKSIEDARYGIKVIDEAHLALKAIMRFDAICNIKHNWYLSATLGRSSMEEDDILNRMYLDADRFVGNASYEEYQKEYINIYLQDIHYYPSRAMCQKYLRFGTKGLIKASYYNMLMHYQDGKPFLNNVIRMIKIAKNTETYDGRILILLPMLEIIDTVVAMMKRDPFFSGAKIGVINGKIPMRERVESMECDYILSTSASAGTGVDFKNLGCVVNFDQAASLIITEQIVVRLRDRGKECWYFDIRDIVKYARSFEHWGRNRRMVLSYIPGVHPDLKKLPDIRC